MFEGKIFVDGKEYSVVVESSGNRGSYAQWWKTWVTEVLPKEKFGYSVPNTHICGSRYWNDHCWFCLYEKAEYDGQPWRMDTAEEVVIAIRANVDEIHRRAMDVSHHMG